MSFSQNQPHRRSLRERLRDGLTSNIPFQNKSRSVDSSQQSQSQNQNQLSFPTTLDDLISLNPFKDNNTPPVPTTVIVQPPQVEQSRQHVVLKTDTIPSIAANYDLTPSELIRFNRLSSRIIFPGQILKIPSRTTNVKSTTESSTTSTTEPTTPVIYQRKFLKIHVRHITDGRGVVSGTLLVTPNAVMFDPNVSDPLVLDQGAENYGVILPLEVIVCAGIFSDIANMRIEGKIYKSGLEALLYPEQVIKKEEDKKRGEGEEEKREKEEEGQGNDQESEIKQVIEQKNIPMSNSNIKGVITAVEPVTSHPLLINNEKDNNESLINKGNDEVLNSNQVVTMTTTTGAGTSESRKTKVLKRLSFPLAWMEALGTGAGGGSGPSGSNVIGCSKEETSQSAPPIETQSSSNKINYRSLVSLDDMPDLFASFDKLLPFHNNTTSTSTGPQQQSQQHQNQSTTFQSQQHSIINVSNTLTNSQYLDDSNPPWYLCLTTGLKIDSKLKPGLVVSYGQKKIIKPEYWFGIPWNQVDELYKYWNLWWPHLYGLVDEELIKSRGYELVDYNTELYRDELSNSNLDDDISNTSLNLKGELGELTKESWEMIKAPYTKLYSFIQRSSTLLSGSGEETGEVVSMSEELRKALYGSSEDYLPELIGISEILNEDDIKNLSKNLSARAEGYPWILNFSTSRDGFSLSTLYRKMENIEIESPILIIIQDSLGRVFGSLVSTPFRLSDHFYGTGQSFLFRSRPGNFEIFKWTGENLYFIKGNLESISIGAGDGKFGLWLDGDLNVGRSESCSTYNNPPLVEEKDFIIKTIECWNFGSTYTSSTSNYTTTNTGLVV